MIFIIVRLVLLLISITLTLVFAYAFKKATVQLFFPEKWKRNEKDRRSRRINDMFISEKRFHFFSTVGEREDYLKLRRAVRKKFQRRFNRIIWKH